MQQLDYIVVGLGIAGITICERLGALGKTFAVVNKTTESATRVAGGTINPVVLKRLTAVWKANGFLNEAVPFYKKLNTKLSRPFYKKTEIKRIFHNVAEQNDWGIACGNDSSTGFLVPEISKNNNPNLRAPFGFGTVQGAAFVNTTLLLDEYAAGLRSKQFLMEGAFEHQHLDISKKYITYKNIKAGKIIFAEGTGVLDNPYFGISCTVPKKGEYLIVKAPGLKLKKIVKGPFFIIPLGAGLYKIGATFMHGEGAVSTKKSRKQLITAAQKMIACNFTTVKFITGTRPTVVDKRPLLGSFNATPNLYFFNGLGTRGLLMAPLLSKWLVDFAENGNALPPEVDVKRFT